MEPQITKNLNSNTFTLLFTSLIAAFGPIVTDLYLPAMPQMNGFFNTSTSSVQLSLTVSFLGLAVGQLLFGPLSDKYGRKIPLMISLLLFVFSTLGCIFSKSIEAFIFFRLIQGFAGAGGVVISRSIAVDLYKGGALVKFLSLLTAVQGLAPIIAPLAGGLLMKITNWQGIFIVLLILGILIFSASLSYKESLAKKDRLRGPVLDTFRHFFPILKNKVFMSYTMALSFSAGTFFGYISASPFIFQQVYELSPLIYSVLFASNAVGFIIGSQVARFFSNSRSALRFGAYSMFIAMILQAFLLSFSAPVYLIEILFFIIVAFNGVIFPSSTVLALELESKAAGNASAVIGFTHFLVGGLVSPLVGIGSVLISTGVVLLICSLLCVLFSEVAILQSSKIKEGVSSADKTISG